MTVRSPAHSAGQAAQRATRLAACAVLAALGALLLAPAALAQAGTPAPAAPAVAAAPAAAAAPVPVADFFRPAAMARPVLSPSGQHLAVQVGGSDGRTKLAVISVVPPRQARVVAGFNDTDIDDIHWADDERLVFDVADRDRAADHWSAPGLYAVNRDGSGMRPLVRRKWELLSNQLSAARTPALAPNHQLLRVLRDGSADVVLQRIDHDTAWREVVGATLVRLDTRTGRSRPVDTGWSQRDAQRWWIDKTGTPRVLASRQGDMLEYWWRAGPKPAPDAPWTLLERQALYLPAAGQLAGLHVGDNGALYGAAAERNAAGTEALFQLDDASGKLQAEPLLRLDGFDYSGQLVFDDRSGTLLGVHYLSDAWSTAWFDAGMQAVQARVDKQLPGLVNLLGVAECGCSRWMVVSSLSDRQPPVFWLYDREADRLESVGQAQPQIDPRRMAQQDFVRFAARDGLSIPLHVTRPQGKGPWPTVVLVHGGPHVRGADWQWDDEAQFLASRGYLVLQPEFRGSTGYGSRLFAAGMKQWGRKSQDDIADALAWAVARGDADASRACIAGGSYGGYAALMGLIRDPQRYRCGLAWMAVTDIGLMYSLRYSDLPEVWRQHGMPRLIGDPVADAAQLAATSPLQQAHRLQRPLLMAAGGVDRRVPVTHATRFKAALPETYTGLTWLLYPDEGHGLYKPENRIDFWRRAEQFLATHLAPQQAPAAR